MANLEHEVIINQGVKIWNQWRNKNPEIEPDLVEANIKISDLSGVNFSNTYLCDTFLIGKNLSKANFEEAMLDFSVMRYSDCSYSNFKKVSFVGTSMRKTNLYRADIRGACFGEARLFEANFSKTNLKKARFVATQLLGVKFTGANLTGTCLENCNINSLTDFSDVICDYIFFQQNGLDRRPYNQNKIFAPGEFSKLFQTITETVDLIFSDGINWQAFLHSFQKLQIECNSEELAIQAIERKSGGAFVISIEVSPNADKAEIEKYIYQQYELKLKSLEDNYKLQLGAKEEQIAIYRQHNTDLLEIIKLKANQPINNSMSNINQIHSGSGDNVAKDKNTTNIYNSQDLTQAAADIQALLEQLDKTYDASQTTGKMTIATQAIETINNDVNLTQRIIGAFKTGSISALESLLNHPAASFFIAALEDWQQTKK